MPDRESTLPSPKPGDAVRWWRPGVAEHGWRAVVLLVDARGVWPLALWSSGGAYSRSGPLPLEQVVTEAEYQRRRAELPPGRRELWLA
jgi:hypothetical protein